MKETNGAEREKDERCISCLAVCRRHMDHTQRRRTKGRKRLVTCYRREEVQRWERWEKRVDLDVVHLQVVLAEDEGFQGCFWVDFGEAVRM